MLKLLMVLRVALTALTVNKMRTFLTMLGIVIGVAAVIALVAVGEGAQAAVVSNLQGLGTNLLTVSPAMSFGFSGRGLQQSASMLSLDDVEALEALATAVSEVAPEYGSNVTATYQGNTTSTSVTGTTANYDAVRSYDMSRGRFISDADNANLATVVVLGETVVKDLFGSTLVNPVGQTIRINRQNYQVIGVLESKGQSGFSNPDDVIIMPIRTAQLRLGGAGNQQVRSISLQAESAEAMDLAQAQATAILRTLHCIQSGDEADFTVSNQADLVGVLEQTVGTFTTLLGSIAAISLLVGGIGIMNIMLVSVTERTREVGLRKAVGANRADVLIQFLAEAIVLSIVGGLVGTLLGIGGAQLVGPLLGGAQTLVTPQSVALALGVSLGIGVFFGFYPANRAAQLNPIDALRYE